MPSKRILKNIKFITDLKRAIHNPVVRRQILKKSGRPEISTISEISKNLLYGTKIPLTRAKKRRLCKYKRELHRLASRKIGYRRKKRRILKGGFAATSALLSVAIPLITSLISRGRK